MQKQENQGVVELTENAEADSKNPKQIANKCPECKSSNIVRDYDTGESICGDCGLVLSQQMVDRGPEWRAFDDEQRAARTRVGAPTKYSVHDKGLSTSVGGGPSGVGYDAFGRKLSVETRIQMGRLRRWQTHSRVHSSFDRNLAEAMTELDRICGKMNLPPPIKEKAAVIYRKALDKGIVRGRSIIGMTAAALYATCRSTGTQRTLREIAEASLTDKKDVARCYRTLIRELETKMPFQDPIGCVSKIAERTGISGKSQGLAVQLLRQAGEKKYGKMAHHGKDPMGMAAAALYIACLMHDEKKTQRDIAEAASITEVTVRNRLHTIKDVLNLVIPEN